MKKKILPFLAALIILSGCASNEAPVSEESVTASEETFAVTEESITEAITEQEDGAEVSVDAPVFSAESGIYENCFQLEITGNADNIYYTLDGSDPAVSETRMLYTAPISIKKRDGDENTIAGLDPLLFSGNLSHYDRKEQVFTSKVSVPENDAVDKCTVIRAAACDENGNFSDSVSGTYFIGTAEEHIKGIADSCSAAGNPLAVISISLDYDDLFDSESGIYVKGDIWQKAFENALLSGEKIDSESARSFDANYKQKGREWEKKCHIDFFEMSPEECSEKLSQDCGIRIQGNYSRSDLQKGFRLYARSEYGEKRFDYPVFAGKTDVSSFRTLVLRAGGNCAFTAKFNDTYWQTVAEQAGFDCAVQHSRPCVVYLNGEYFGLYVLQEDYSEHYFEDHYGVDGKDVVVYKGDAEKYSTGYYLDEGTLPEGVTDEGYYFDELFGFFRKHSDLKDADAYEEFADIVDTDSVRDYFLAQVWINNKWDWPGKNWSMWKTANNDGSEYGDGRWRFMYYDMEFGGVSGKSDIAANTVKDDNYKPEGLLDMDTNNPAVLCFAYLMTNDDFRADYCSRLENMSEGSFSSENLNAVLGDYIAEYSPLYEQFFERYPDSGSPEEAVMGGYASAVCISDFADGRAEMIPEIIKWINEH